MPFGRMLFTTPSTLRIFFVYVSKWLIYERMWLFSPSFWQIFVKFQDKKFKLNSYGCDYAMAKCFETESALQIQSCSFVLTFYFATSICFKFLKNRSMLYQPPPANQFKTLVVHLKTLLVRFPTYILKSKRVRLKICLH